MPDTSTSTTTPQSDQVDKRVRDSAFWVYSVIVGGVIKEAIDKGVPRLLGLIPDKPPSPALGLRFVVVLILVIRFYLGAVVHFAECYHAEKPPDKAVKPRHYLLDFTIGLLHFVFFYALAMTIDIETPTLLFLALLGAILMYDIPWWLMTGGTRRVRTWTIVNSVTFVTVVAIYLALRAGGVTPLHAEAWSILLVLAVSVTDMAGIVRGKDIFASLAEQAFKKDD
jgi:hypothetical protein